MKGKKIKLKCARSPLLEDANYDLKGMNWGTFLTQCHLNLHDFPTNYRSSFSIPLRLITYQVFFKCWWYWYKNLIDFCGNDRYMWHFYMMLKIDSNLLCVYLYIPLSLWIFFLYTLLVNLSILQVILFNITQNV